MTSYIHFIVGFRASTSPPILLSLCSLFSISSFHLLILYLLHSQSTGSRSFSFGLTFTTALLVFSLPHVRNVLFYHRLRLLHCYLASKIVCSVSRNYISIHYQHSSHHAEQLMPGIYRSIGHFSFVSHSICKSYQAEPGEEEAVAVKLEFTQPVYRGCSRS